MTLEEIKEYLRDHDVEPTADMIDMVQSLHDASYEDGYEQGREDGWKAKEKQDKQIEKVSFELAARGVLGDNWEELLEYYGIQKPE